MDRFFLNLEVDHLIFHESSSLDKDSKELATTISGYRTK